jgi:DNA topoisomerase VI subunit B
MASTPTLQRTTFKTSRLLDFASEKELTAQTGHHPDAWPLVILKELVDNALDACEEAGIAPCIMVSADASGITVSDNGPGLPASTIKGVLDFEVRTSSREAYVSPTRGAQGNALKTIVAMPFVLDGKAGRVEITVSGITHLIDFAVDRIKQEPLISHTEIPAECKKGTVFKVCWPKSPRLDLTESEARFLQMAQDYTWLNPHLTLDVVWYGECTTLQATEQAWAKWRPSEPTSPHWYDGQRLGRLVAGYLSNEATAGRTVRQFVSEFRGLSGSVKPKAVLASVNMGHEPLAALVANKDIDHKLIGQLLTAMQAHSTLVKPKALGQIGRKHFEVQFGENACKMDSFNYHQEASTTNGMPWVIEVAFASCPTLYRRRLVTGVNWSPGIQNPFRELGSFGRSLDEVLTQQRCDWNEPVTLALHLICPRVDYVDRGKSALVATPEQAEAIVQAVLTVTKKWRKFRERQDRNRSAELSKHDALPKTGKMNVKEAAWQVMEAAYLKASANGTLPAHARQIMYAARPDVLLLTGETKMDDGYFIKTLLADYIIEKGVDWNVAYDPRGNFIEPHTKVRVPLGTLQVRNYLANIQQHKVWKLSFNIAEARYPTYGPKNRYQAILFIEKEGFMPLFDQVKLAERYDLGIMSTKGTSVTAARSMLDTLCSDHGIKLLVLHDFDKAGFSILNTLVNDTRRYQFAKKVEVIDLGIRLEDTVGLVSEPVDLPESAADNLRASGATDAEVEFLLTRRVELNAFASDQFIAWIEAKLKQHGITKVVPDEITLDKAYRRIRQEARVQRVIDEALDNLEEDAGDVPDTLAKKISELQNADPTLTWDEALKRIVFNTEGTKGSKLLKRK